MNQVKMITARVVDKSIVTSFASLIMRSTKGGLLFSSVEQVEVEVLVTNLKFGP